MSLGCERLADAEWSHLWDSENDENEYYEYYDDDYYYHTLLAYNENEMQSNRAHIKILTVRNHL